MISRIPNTNEKELGEHQAKAELEQAKKILQKMLKSYPKSDAVKQARKMLGLPQVDFTIELDVLSPGAFGISSEQVRKLRKQGIRSR